MTNGFPFIHVKRMGHLALDVADLDRAEKFYTQIFDLRVAHKRGKEVLLRCGADYLTIREVKPTAARAPARMGAAIGMDHFGLAVAPEDFDAAVTQLQAAGVRQAGEVVAHANGTRSVYFEDPDGNIIEIWDEPSRNDQ